MSYEIAINRVALAKLGKNEEAKNSKVKEIVAVSFSALFVSITMIALGFYTLKLAANLGMVFELSPEQLVFWNVLLVGLYSIPVIHAMLKEQITQMLFTGAPMFFIVGGIMYSYVQVFGH
ncbi:MAG: hypothetical protein K2X81_13695 [Candidatus Obscuribacterales bacterium]|nr:hypothetical protein [Candidatus Obscuribacterales bacterium]